MFILKTVFGLALLAALAWVVAKPDYDSFAAAASALAALVGTVFAERKRKASQVQEVGPGGIGIQAGGNVQTGNVQSTQSGNKNA